jgi:hypothetical protein
LFEKYLKLACINNKEGQKHKVKKLFVVLIELILQSNILHI